MIGQPVEGPPSFPLGGIVFGLIGMGLVAVAIFTASLHYAIGALLPFFVSLLLWKARRPAFSPSSDKSAGPSHFPGPVLDGLGLDDRGRCREGVFRLVAGRHLAGCFRRHFLPGVLASRDSHPGTDQKLAQSVSGNQPSGP